jgi:hypothetical protein
MDVLQKEINKWKKIVPLITSLKSESMEKRHWEEFNKLMNCPDLKIDDNLTFRTFYEMDLQLKSEEITEITDKSSSELKMGKKIRRNNK